MIWYLIIGLISANVYFLKSKDEKRLQKTTVVFLFWPLIVIVVLVMLPGAVYKIIKEK